MVNGLKVLVADDHEFVRGGIVSELKDIISDAVFLEACDAKSVLDILDANKDVRLAILDLYMPGSNQYGLVKKVCKKHPQLLVVVMTASEDSRDLQAVIECGVSGYIPKALGKDIVNYALRLVLAGDTYFPDNMMKNIQSNKLIQLESNTLQNKISALTTRQKEVLTLLLEGNANKGIANNLNLSENTIKIHVTAILRVLDFHSRSQVMAGVREMNLNIIT